MASGEKLKKNVAISGTRRPPDSRRAISNRKKTLAAWSSSMSTRPVSTGLPNARNWCGKMTSQAAMNSQPPGAWS